MKRLFSRFLMAAIAAIFICGGTARATTLTGTLNNPDGSPFNGTIFLTLSQAGTISSTGTCGGPIYVPNTFQVSIQVVAGAIVSSPSIYDSMCFATPGIPYSVQLVSSTGAVVAQTWVITSSPLQTGSENVGTIIPISISGVVFQLPAAANVTSFLFGSTSVPLSSTVPSGSTNYLCNVSGQIVGCSGGAGGMTWPSGGAGIPNYTGGSAYGTTYNSSTHIPANFLDQASNSALGLARCDGTTTTCVAGVITSAAGGASTPATSVLLKGNGSANGVVAATAADVAALQNSSPVAAAGAVEQKNTVNPNLNTWLQAFHNCQNQVVHVTLFADSQGMVDHVNDTGVGPTVAANRYADQLRTYLNGVCGSHGTGVVPIWTFLYPGSPNPAADNWTKTGTVAQSAILGPSQNSTLGPYAGTLLGSVAQMSTGAVLTFTSPYSYDHLNLYYVKTTAALSIGVSVDGSSVGTITATAGSNTAALFTSSAVTAGTHTATITCTTGPCYVYAAEGTLGTTGASVDNLSLASGVAEDYSGATGSTPFAFADLIPGGIQLAIEAYGTNEPALGYSTTSFGSAIASIVSHEATLNSASTLITSPPVNNQATYGAQMPTYAATGLAEAIALNTSYVSYIDNWGASFVSGLFGSDGLHPNDKGALSEFSMIKNSVVDTDPNSTTASSNLAYLNVINTFIPGQIISGLNPFFIMQGNSSSTLAGIEYNSTANGGHIWLTWAQSTTGQNGLVFLDNSVSGGMSVFALNAIVGTSYASLGNIGGYCWNGHSAQANDLTADIDTCIWRTAAGSFNFGNATLNDRSGTVNAGGFAAQGAAAATLTALTLDASLNTGVSGQKWYVWAQSTTGQNGLIFHSAAFSGLGALALNLIDATHAKASMGALGVFGWNSNNEAANVTSAIDTGVSRESADVIDVGNGTAGDKSGTIKAAGFNGSLLLSGTTGTITGTALSATCDSGTATVTGAVVGHPVSVSSTTGVDVGAAFYLRGSVTATNTVTVYVCGTGTPSSLAYNVVVF